MLGEVSHRQVVIGSNRSFGFVFAFFFAMIGLLPTLSGDSPKWWALAIAMPFVGVALLRPQLLTPMNRLWFKLGLFLQKIVNPILMALIYFGAIVPTGLVLRALGQDSLRLKTERNAPSYWIMREPPGPAVGSMTKQF